jgi:hypothetical protein
MMGKLEYGTFPNLGKDANGVFCAISVLVGKEFRIERLSRVAFRPSSERTRSVSGVLLTGIAREELLDAFNIFVSGAN